VPILVTVILAFAKVAPDWSVARPVVGLFGLCGNEKSSARVWALTGG
jgi:hypothetical protein